MTYRFVQPTFDGAVATLTLKRPPLNAMNLDMMDEIAGALLDLRSNKELKVLVVRGSGDVFSAGLDIGELTRDKTARMLQVFHRIFETLRLLDVITIAAVHGAAIGGGFELAIGCNLMLATESAKFRLPEVNLGIFAPLACVMLPRVIPRRKAMERILMGNEISAQDLDRFGLVNWVLPDDEFESGLESVTKQLTSKSGPVLRLARRAQWESYYAGFEEALYKAESLYLRDLIPLADAQEGIAAFLEKRSPQWRDA